MQMDHRVMFVETITLLTKLLVWIMALLKESKTIENLMLFFEPMQKNHHNMDKKANVNYGLFFIPSQWERTITWCLFIPSLYVQKC